LWLPLFKSVESVRDIDTHLLRIGLLRNAGGGRIKLTLAGRVVRRLLQELEQCSASA
jgi:hypothetical protein